MCTCVLISQSCLTLCNLMDCSSRQAPRSMGLPRQEHWSGWPFPSSGDFPDPGSNPGLLHAHSYCLSHQGSLLFPRPGVQPAPPAVEAQSLNHWTAREFLAKFVLSSEETQSQLPGNLGISVSLEQHSFACHSCLASWWKLSLCVLYRASLVAQ